MIVSLLDRQVPETQYARSQVFQLRSLPSSALLMEMTALRIFGHRRWLAAIGRTESYAPGTDYLEKVDVSAETSI
jgi:hypothetical protein